jgi:FtsZ-interacting cell division protein YlmF
MNLNKLLQTQTEVGKIEENPIAIKSDLNILIRTPKAFKDVQDYADFLIHGNTILVSFSNVEVDIKQRIFDYLNGVSYIIDANVEKISDDMTLYVPNTANVSKDSKRRSWLK